MKIEKILSSHLSNLLRLHSIFSILFLLVALAGTALAQKKPRALDDAEFKLPARLRVVVLSDFPPLDVNLDACGHITTLPEIRTRTSQAGSMHS